MAGGGDARCESVCNAMRARSRWIESDPAVMGEAAMAWPTRLSAGRAATTPGRWIGLLLPKRCGFAYIAIVCTRTVPFVSSLMAKPTIFTISAVWDETASVWSGHCDDIPAAADAPSLDELLAKISAMALDMLPDNQPDINPATLYLQMTALREAEPTSV